MLIVGSRSIKEFDLSPYIPEEVDTVISGGSGGIDSLAERYADLHRLSKYILRPRYDIYVRAAPLKRNEKMVDMADAVLVHMGRTFQRFAIYSRIYKKMNKPVTLIRS